MTDCTKPGGVKNCTQWGVITQGVAHQDYWIHMARYGVKCKSVEEAVIDNVLEEMRRQFLTVTSTKQTTVVLRCKNTTVTLLESHQMEERAVGTVTVSARRNVGAGIVSLCQRMYM